MIQDTVNVLICGSAWHSTIFGINALKISSTLHSDNTRSIFHSTGKSGIIFFSMIPFC